MKRALKKLVFVEPSSTITGSKPGGVISVATSRAPVLVESATSIARQTVDCVITPIVERAEKEREDFYGRGRGPVGSGVSV